jgi:hypothetical protein
MNPMKEPVTQELEYGCGVACFAFVCDLTFKQAVDYLGKEYSVKHGWKPSDLVAALNSFGFSYKNNYVRKKSIDSFLENTIVLIEKSSEYPVGHYLVKQQDKWMDPWINMTEDDNLAHAKSGYRKLLPGKAMYSIAPTSKSL